MTLINPYIFGAGTPADPVLSLDEITTLSPSIYLPLNGDDMTDHGSLGVTVTKTGSGGWTATDIDGRSLLAFDGSTYLQLGDVLDITTANFSYCIAFSLASGAVDALCPLVDKTNISTANGQYYMIYDNRSSQGSPRRLRALKASGTDPVDYLAPATSTVETLRMVHYTRAGTTQKLYYDGTLQDTSSDAATGAVNALQLTLGASSNGTSFRIPSGARLTQFAAWNGTELTSTQVANQAAEFNAR